MKYINLLIIIFALTACKSQPASPTSFIKDEWKLENGTILQRVWKDPQASLGHYTKFALKPVGTTYLRPMDWWDKKNAPSYSDEGIFPSFDSRNNRKAAKYMAKYFDQQMKLAFKQDPQNELIFTSYVLADSQTLVMEIQITELVPVKKYFYGLGFFGSLKGGIFAIEGKITNGRSGKLLMMFTDRKVNNDIKNEDDSYLSWYGHAKPMIRDWSKYFARLANSKL